MSTSISPIRMARFQGQPRAAVDGGVAKASRGQYPSNRSGLGLCTGGLVGCAAVPVLGVVAYKVLKRLASTGLFLVGELLKRHGK
ncbi:MAG: hypothetical protein R2857_13405 [Vampirovibrionales bacterium]|nr:hypothetical protein [Cyanobacteria bacterium HKST-UBA03]